MDQLERIKSMEAILDQGTAALAALSEALETYAALQPKLEALADYYESPLWRQDFEDDEAGRFPIGLKRGVLSEDAVYDLLSKQAQLLALLKKLLK